LEKGVESKAAYLAASRATERQKAALREVYLDLEKGTMEEARQDEYYGNG
jgi:DNA-binding FadR family transcriptional regulator